MIIKSAFSRLMLSVCFLGYIAGGPLTVSAATTIKVAMITPEGYPWTNALYRMADAVKRKTSGEVALQVFAGGVSGDEVDVIRKMRADRLQAAGLSGVGLGILLPEIRILEAPLLYRSYEEIDYIKGRLREDFSRGFEQKGYVLLGFAEAGFVYFFSKKAMTGPDGFDALKMWVWKSDPVAKASLEAFGINAIPLHLMDVNTGLETGMINSFYSPPLAAIAFQWHPKVEYMLDYPMVNSTGALIIRKRTFERLSAAHRRLLQDEAVRFCDELVRLARRDNKEALSVLQDAGIRFEVPTAAQKADFERSARQIYEQSAGRIYPRKLFDRVNTLLNEYRRSNP